MKKITGRKKTEPKDHLMNTATKLVEMMGTPSRYLEFIQEALTWIHQHQVRIGNKDESRDPHFDIVLHIEHIVQPWFAGGENMMDNIARGLESINEALGYDGYHDGLAMVVAAYSADFESGLPTPEYLKRDFLGVATLHEIYYGLYYYYYAKKEAQKEKQKTEEYIRIAS